MLTSDTSGSSGGPLRERVEKAVEEQVRLLLKKSRLLHEEGTPTGTFIPLFTVDTTRCVYVVAKQGPFPLLDWLLSSLHSPTVEYNGASPSQGTLKPTFTDTEDEGMIALRENILRYCTTHAKVSRDGKKVN